MVESIKPWAWKNFGFFFPPPAPLPSQYEAPLPFRLELGAPLMEMLTPDIESRGPVHSWKAHAVSPWNVTLAAQVRHPHGFDESTRYRGLIPRG